MNVLQILQLPSRFFTSSNVFSRRNFRVSLLAVNQIPRTLITSGNITGFDPHSCSASLRHEASSYLFFFLFHWSNSSTSSPSLRKRSPVMVTSIRADLSSFHTKSVVACQKKLEERISEVALLSANSSTRQRGGSRPVTTFMNL